MTIMNGRLCQDANIGNITCKNASVVDYVILSHCLFQHVSDFFILDFNGMYSDVHSAINIVFNYMNSPSIMPVHGIGCTPGEIINGIVTDDVIVPNDVPLYDESNDHYAKWDTGMPTCFRKKEKKYGR